MKKVISAILIILTVLLLTKCTQYGPKEYKVYYSDTSGVSVGEPIDEKIREITSYPQEIVKENMPDKTFSFDGTRYELKYSKTYVWAGVENDCYEGNSDGKKMTASYYQNSSKPDSWAWYGDKHPEYDDPISRDEALSLAEKYIKKNITDSKKYKLLYESVTIFNDSGPKQIRFVFARSVNGFNTTDSIYINVDLYRKTVISADFQNYRVFNGISAFKNANKEEIEASVYSKYEELIEKAKDSYFITPYEGDEVKVGLKYRNGSYYLEYTFPVRVKYAYKEGQGYTYEQWEKDTGWASMINIIVLEE